jgi:hypothetical protein
MYVSKVWESVARRGRKPFMASWGLRMSHICPCTPCPPPQGIGQRSKVVILPTTAFRGEVGWSWALEIKTFLDPVKCHRADTIGECHLGPKKEPTGDFKWVSKEAFRAHTTLPVRLSNITALVWLSNITAVTAVAASLLLLVPCCFWHLL